MQRENFKVFIRFSDCTIRDLASLRDYEYFITIH